MPGFFEDAGKKKWGNFNLEKSTNRVDNIKLIDWLID